MALLASAGVAVAWMAHWQSLRLMKKVCMKILLEEGKGPNKAVVLKAFKSVMLQAFLDSIAPVRH
jgi:hypothetical protein